MVPRPLAVFEFSGFVLSLFFPWLELFFVFLFGVGGCSFLCWRRCLFFSPLRETCSENLAPRILPRESLLRDTCPEELCSQNLAAQRSVAQRSSSEKLAQSSVIAEMSFQLQCIEIKAFQPVGRNAQIVRNPLHSAWIGLAQNCFFFLFRALRNPLPLRGFGGLFTVAMCRKLASWLRCALGLESSLVALVALQN